MSKLRIPESHREGFKLLSSLSESDFKKLHIALSKTDKGILPDELTSLISEETRIDKNINSEITKILFSVYSLKEKFGEDVDQLVNELLLALRNANVDLGAQTKWKRLEERIKSLISFDKTIGNTFKALKLLSDYDRIYINSKIVTDIRPAFNDSDDLSTNTALIVHNLKIGYIKDDQHQETYLALDSNDLDELKKQIERAKKKEENLKKSLKDKFLFIQPAKQ
jgi:hypothetical protein